MCLFILPAINSYAQKDTTVNKPVRDSLLRRNAVAEKDTAQSAVDTLLANYKPLHSPRKAAFYSAVLPGLGQIYNRDYWKVPLVYAALGVSTGVFIWNMDKYKEFRDAYRIRVANQNNPEYKDKYPLYTDGDLRYLRDAYRQYVDYSVLVFVAAYALNIVDATVFAHLRQFDISNDLSMRIGPRLINNRTLGIGVNISLSPRKNKPQGLAIR
ncbi:hypothetical protein EG028_03820 [Chitinophaga barathri]|uniref:DUF5683 domain-containing protein n=1 Tax=Chitinophaga barathri TaxID=1647451 RepID=A0A3N4MFW3_9BACT|nr:hypothetical protein EG028_03820 [Chitinophaga barathri]